jgi:hypothetical protein
VVLGWLAIIGAFNIGLFYVPAVAAIVVAAGAQSSGSGCR